MNNYSISNDVANQIYQLLVDNGMMPDYTLDRRFFIMNAKAGKLSELKLSMYPGKLFLSESNWFVSVLQEESTPEYQKLKESVSEKLAELKKIANVSV